MLIALMRSGVHLVRNTVRRAFARPDYRRWNSPGGLQEWWDDRTRILATLVPPASRVIEFGAGRRQLEKYLPDGCVYVPSDLSDRGPGTVVCDLNKRPFPDLQSFSPTVAVFSGVLEYIKDVDSLIRWLAASGIQTFVLSFDSMPTALGPWQRGRELRRRVGTGYMNSLTERELLAIFADHAMRCVERRQWTTQGVYRFERNTD